MHQRLTQHRHHAPPPPRQDLRDRLNRMRDQRMNDEIAGIPPAEDSYIHNLPKPRRVHQPNRPVGKVEWDEGKAVNIKIEVSDNGERVYKIDKEDALKIPPANTECSNQGILHHAKQIIKNENELGMKTRGRGSYRGPYRARGAYRGRGGYRGGRRPKVDKSPVGDNADVGSSSSSGVIDHDHSEEGGYNDLHDEDSEYSESHLYEDHDDHQSIGQSVNDELCIEKDDVNTLSSQLENNMKIDAGKSDSVAQPQTNLELKKEITKETQNECTTAKSTTSNNVTNVTEKTKNADQKLCETTAKDQEVSEEKPKVQKDGE